jgi:prolipoprotein diacylglyceryl transferase
MITMSAVIGGVIGGRLYHVVTSRERYTNDLMAILAINNGGLNIWGALPAGALAVVLASVVLRRRGRQALSASRVIAAGVPGVAVAQAFGRVGNWFNQELYGRPTTLPWSLQVDPMYRLTDASTYHPVFAYEILWMIAGALVLWRVADDRRRITIYVIWYCSGRFVFELLRIDPSLDLGGLRWNGWIALGCGLIAVGWYITTIRSPLLRRAATVTLVTVTVDQFAKACALAYLTDGAVPSDGATLRLLLLTNPGAAFSIGSQITLLYGIAAVGVLGTLAVLRHRVIATTSPIVAGLFAGGVAGNFIDRMLREPHLLRGEVIDFIAIGSFPVFNIADAALCVAALLYLLSVRYTRHSRDA